MTKIETEHLKATISFILKVALSKEFNLYKTSDGYTNWNQVQTAMLEQIDYMGS